MVQGDQAQLNTFQKLKETNEFMAGVAAANKAMKRLEESLPVGRLAEIIKQRDHLIATADARDQLVFGSGAVGDSSSVKGMRASLDADYSAGRF